DSEERRSMSERGGLRLRFAVLSLALACGCAPAVFAQTVPPAPPAPATATPAPPATDPAAKPPDVANPPDAAKLQDTQSALEKLETTISVSQTRRDELKREIDQLNGDRTKQSAALIAAAQRVKLAEIETGSMEERLTALAKSEADVRGRLDGAGKSISNVLAALQRVSQSPPPALLVDPADALGSARSAMLMSAILPQLRAKADAVVADLKHLGEIKAQALDEQTQLKANFSTLEEEQLRIATLISARKQGIDVASAQLSDEQKQAEDLAAKAASLKDLVATLSKRITAVTQAANATQAANSGAAPQNLDPATIKVALANTGRTSPAIPFAAAHGYLTLPSAGVNVMDFGAGDGFGGISDGLSLATRAEAQVVAPADATVIYKGPYLNYGQIVILDPGQDYTILLAGLATVTVDIGQFVLMGEPVGAMGSHTIGRTVTTSAGVSRPTLYIELRKNNVPVDPTGWWAPQSNPTQSG
ncbi:MAG TPA: peptidoglycan DD-metalloendopeptidase family protein, partial [Arsenicitalea sp.]|nr:peptidoglycan DD-metalloendopeptidase family protein [Arsenicitalea sp.]